MSSNTTSIFTALHHELDGYFSLLLEDYELNQNFIKKNYSFKLAFQCMPQLLASGPSKIILNTFEIVFTQKI
jgi:hypothetical protein